MERYTAINADLDGDVLQVPDECEASSHEEAASTIAYDLFSQNTEILNRALKVTDPRGVSKVFSAEAEYEISVFVEEIEE